MISKLEHPTTEELDQLMMIWLTSNVEEHSFIHESYWRKNVQFVRELLPKSDLFVKLIDGKIVGFLGLQEEYLAGIFVHKKYRKQGVGTQLLDEAKKQKLKLHLGVYEKNQSAYHFYLKQGFIISTIQKDETGEIEYLMTWTR